jgi:Ca-activated chloride channel family protein
VEEIKFIQKMMKHLFCIVFCLIAAASLAQKEKRELRHGNDSYFGGKYNEAEQYYLEALKEKNNFYKSNFNLGDAYYKQGKFTEAIGQYDTYIKNSSNKDTLSKAFHNLGNSYLKTKSYNEAITAYKNSLKLNPKDEDTRYNLAYAQKKLQEQQQKNKDKKEDQKKKDDKDKKDQKKEDKDKKDDPNKKPEQQQPQMSKEDAQRILDALKNNEQKLQLKKKNKDDKAEKQNIDKDW